MLDKQEEIQILKKIGSNIRILREEKGISQFNLAYDAGISKNQIGRAERGENQLSFISLLKISIALKVDINEIIKY